jgi:putative protein-disulfide isomerase
MVQMQKAVDQKNNIEDNKADQLEIVYFTDPLCCWSWGFEPQWRRLLITYRGQIKRRYCMGGLLPSWKNFVDPLNSVSRPTQMGPIWMEAAHISGMPIENTLWIKDPPKSSYPACIAVKAAGLQKFEAEEIYLRKIREAVMLHQQNISNLNVLLDIAKEVSALLPGSFDFQRFKNDLQSEEALDAFRKDVAEVQSKQITRFPTLLFRKKGKPSLIITGYRPYHAVRAVMDEMQLSPLKQESLLPGTIYEGYDFMTDKERKVIFEEERSD